MDITDDQLSSIADRIASRIGSRLEISREEHDQHHRFVQTLIEESEERRELWLEMRKSLAKWGAIGLLTAIGLAVVRYWGPQLIK